MAIRTTEVAVKEILGVQYDSLRQPSIYPYMEAAAVLIDRMIECATEEGVTHSAAELEIIERWLAAHFYGQMDQMYSSKSTDGASASFQGQWAKYLDNTRYGQMAMKLDKSGCLETAGADTGQTGRRVAGGFWLGKVPSEQTDYPNRD